jgi:hypothetical protein
MTDHHFTFLPITAAIVECVICFIIFQGKLSEIPAEWASGINIQVEHVRGRESNISMQEGIYFGKGKYFPNGVTCEHRGKEIPCATFISEEGGISGDILVSVLRILDDLIVFRRMPGGRYLF